MIASLCRSMLVLGLVLPMLPLTGQSERNALVGVWKLVAFVDVTPDSVHRSQAAQPGVFIFTQRHYSAMWAEAETPRKKFAGDQPTDAEKIQAYDTFRAMTGSYELSGRKLSLHPTIAKNPGIRQTLSYEVRARGDTLSFILGFDSKDTTKRTWQGLILLRQCEGEGGCAKGKP